MRLGILTGGGDAPGLNAVIRAVVRAAMRTHGWPAVLGIPEGFKGLVERLDPIELTPFTTRGLINRGGTILHTTNRANPFQYPVGEDRYADRSDEAIQRIEELGIDALVVLGGDGSLSIAHKLAAKGVRVMGTPKTIDNDIQGTELCFGHQTAVATATDALDRLHTTAESHHRIMVVELMGRYAGWIALRAGVAGAADAILIPETPFEPDRLCARIRDRAQQGATFSIIVVAEGAKPKGGDVSVLQPGEGVYQAQLGGIGHQVAGMLEGVTHLETRVTVLGHVQRGGGPVAQDRLLATHYGVAAVDALARGEHNSMVTFDGQRIGTIPLEQVAGGFRPVPQDHPLLESARQLGVILGE
ncbi:6-phosphofructokinase [Thiohalorhabdus denitrificans]|uniref:ATP-dependent 6-phosphofructokinase n=1 Tax=Thiohalorhabdus denitrificans TaxID=381306 RepID=A0A0P9EST4_9GAMM|nr:ATP-dependent 6-phosphofructokinase [Thiohalorhabdus denitrificans]KPV41727.1 6-phosphofructokinase [Thiohalorhabdus denitrificans]SCY54173.1 6-phosphofructokinase 1 [Thiohalorhabdus denitrificans]